jgi:hypothetical protein
VKFVIPKAVAMFRAFSLGSESLIAALLKQQTLPVHEIMAVAGSSFYQKTCHILNSTIWCIYSL